MADTYGLESARRRVWNDARKMEEVPTRTSQVSQQCTYMEAKIKQRSELPKESGGSSKGGRFFNFSLVKVTFSTSQLYMPAYGLQQTPAQKQEQ
jgi:hypothetical protein